MNNTKNIEFKDLESIIDNIDVGILLYSYENGFSLQYSNREIKNLLGYNEDEIEELSLKDLIYSKNDSKNLIMLQDFIDKKIDEFKIFKQFSHKTGKQVWAEIKVSKCKANLENKQAIICRVEDKSHLVKVESDLLKSEDKYQTLVENVNELFFILNIDGRIEYVNNAVIRLSQFDPNELINKNFSQFIPTEYRSAALDIFESAKTGERSNAELKIITKKSDPLWVRASLAPIFDGDKVIKVQGLITDISDKKELEKTLIESERYYRNITEILNEGIIIHAKDGTVKRCNESAADILELDIGNIIGNKPNSSSFKKIHDDGSPYLESQHPVSITLKTGFSVSNALMGLVKEDGTVKWILINSKPLKNLETNEVEEVIVSFNDITKLKLMESKLRDSEKRLRTYINQADDSIFIIDAKGNIIDANLGACKKLDYSYYEITRMQLQDIDPYFSKEEVIDYFNSKGSNQKYFFNSKHFTKDKNSFPVEVNIQRLDIDGENIFIALARDISEKKKVESALKESEEKYRILFNNSGDAILIISLEGEILEVNQVTINRLGYSNEEIIGMRLKDLDYFESEQEIQERLNRLTDNGKIVFTTTHATKYGKQIPTEVNSKLITYQGKTVILSVARDLTERVLAEETIRKSEERFRQVAESAEEWIWEVNIEGLYTFSSPGIKTILGYEPEEIVGKKYFYEFFLNENMENLKNVALKMFQKGLPFKHFINPNKHKNGQTVFLETTALPVYDKENNLIGYRGVDSNVTERIRFENKLQAALKKEIETKELMTKFISTASHEFRTPLTTINSSVEFLDLINASNDPKFEEHYNRIKKAVKRIDKLIEDLLYINIEDYSRLKYDPTRFSFTELVDDIIDEIKNLSNGKHKIVSKINLSDETIYSDIKLLRFILSNLLSNGIKYMPNGGKLILNVSSTNNYLKIRVKDNGIGIPENEIDSIFEPFHRATNIEEIPGTGFGLSIVKNAVELLNGNIKVNSEINKGTTFIVSIPLKNIAGN